MTQANQIRFAISDLPGLVSGLEKYMFRLETYPFYADDDDIRARWQAGQDITDEIVSCQWSKSLLARSKAGVTCSRVHLIPDELTEYLRFEIFGYYPISSKLGEQIFILPRSDFSNSECCKFASSGQDFLLMDDKLFLHKYTVKDMTFEYTEMLPSDADLADAKREMQLLLNMSIPLSDYIAKNRG